jgi:hypothetical protein
LSGCRCCKCCYSAKVFSIYYNVMCYLDVSTSRTCNLDRHSPCSIKTRVAKRTGQTISLHFIARLSFHPSLITVNIIHRCSMSSFSEFIDIIEKLGLWLLGGLDIRFTYCYLLGRVNKDQRIERQVSPALSLLLFIS